MAKEKLTKLPAAGTLRVWWIPQVPGKPFHVAVASPLEAKKLLIVLAKYDLFQFHHNIKGDYSNAGGLEEVSRDGRNWYEWNNEDNRDINEMSLEELQGPAPGPEAKASADPMVEAANGLHDQLSNINDTIRSGFQELMQQLAHSLGGR